MTRVRGAQRAIRRLGSLASKIKKRVIRKAHRAGGTIIAREVRRGTPRDSGTMKKSIRSVHRFYRRTGTFYTAVGVRSKKIGGRNPAKYAHLVAKGTRPHRIGGRLRFVDGAGQAHYTSDVEHPGARPNDFQLQAFKRSRRRAFRRYKAKLAVEIRREVRSLGA